MRDWNRGEIWDEIDPLCPYFPLPIWISLVTPDSPATEKAVKYFAEGGASKGVKGTRINNRGLGIREGRMTYQLKYTKQMGEGGGGGSGMIHPSLSTILFRFPSMMGDEIAREIERVNTQKGTSSTVATCIGG